MIVAAVVAAASLLVLAAQAQIPADPVAAAEFLVHYSGQGHCEEPEILAWSCNQPQCQNTMGTFSTTFYTTVKTGGHAYSAVNERQEAIFFVVRGTDNPRNTLQDARFLFVRYLLQSPPMTLTRVFQTQLAGAPEGVEVHKGFYASWLDFEPQVIPQLELLRQAHPTFKIYTTGHSLGGAVAVMAAAHMHLLGWNVTSYSYGQPRVGNPAFAQWFQSVEPDAVRITAVINENIKAIINS